MQSLLPRLRRAALRLAAPLLLLGASAAFAAKPIVIIETDIGGDKDDQASFVRLLLHANELDIRAIICDRPASNFNDGAAWNPSPSTIFNGVDMANHYLNAYNQVDENLRLHDPDYPTAATLLSRVYAGYPGVNNGRDRIIAVVDGLAAGEVVYYSNWGSNVPNNTSSLRRAFDHILSTRGSSGLNTFVAKILQVSLDGDGDIRSGHTAVVRAHSSHVETGYPTDSQGRRWYHRFQPITQAAGGFSMSSDISDTHGPLAPLYRGAGQKEGDSWSTLYVLPFGMNDLAQPAWGGPAGRYTPRDAGPTLTLGVPFYWNNATDTWNGTTSRDNTAMRFAAAVQNAFRARWDWCYMNFASANHDPVPTMTINGGNAVTAGIRRLSLPASTTVNLAATVSDPDSGDSHTYAWTYYREAGTYAGNLTLAGATSANASFFIPSDAAGKQLHVYLAVTDDGSRKGNRVPNLTRFCRAVIDVTPVGTTAPAAPTNFAVSSASATSLQLTWTDNASNETGYTIERKIVTSGGTTPTVSLVNYAGIRTTPTVEPANSAESFKIGARQANDRTDTWTSVPAALAGAPRLFTSRLDRMTAPTNALYTIHLSGPGKIYVVLDGRYGTQKLSWMGSEWTDSGLTATTTEVAPGTWRLWERSVSAAGNVILGVDTAQYSGVTYVFAATGGGSSTTWQTVATLGANATSHTHTGLTTGTTYTYRIRANGSTGNSAWSPEVSGTPSAPATEDWTGQDVGSIGVAGNSSYNASTDTFTIQASGADIFNTADSFRYVTLDGGLVGDGEIVARVASIGNTHSWAKAGLMIRDGLANNARNVAVLVSPNNNVSFQNRPTDGAATATTTATGVGAPRWLRLVRSGNNFTGYHSTDGVNWTQHGATVSLTLPSNLQIGLCVTSHNNSTLTTAAIDNVAVTP